jgi:transposase
VLSDSDTLAPGLNCLAPVGQRSDRAAAHYYRAMHMGAVQREQQWKERALAGEQISKQLLVVVAWCVQQIGALTRQLAWLKKQQFGSKSEASQPSDRVADEGGVVAGTAQDAEQAETGTKQTVPPTRRSRGQQPGGKGPKRQRRLNLPLETIHHTVPETERTCPICGKIRAETGLTEESEEIEWKVCLVRKRHVRHRYGPSCDCPPGRGIVTAPKPAKLICKGLFAVSFWVQVLLKKFEFQQPLQRIVRELKAHDLKVSPGTLTGGLEKIQPMVQPLAGQFVLRSREGSHWQMDETGWPMFCLPEGKSRQRWWAWVVVSPEVTAFLVEPTRSGQVPQDFFPKGTEGIVNVDRFAAYFALLGPDWKIQLAYCWSHQRRDFVNLGEGCRRWAEWCEPWVGLINRLFAANRQRRQAWSKQRPELFGPLDQEVRRQVQEIQERVERELAAGQLAPEQEKILQSMRRHWEGLTVFVDHPHVPMDNNAAERALRALAVARKNFYGSGSLWSGELAGACFTILATLRQHGICPRRYFQAYLEACARQGGKAPDNLEEFLPWKWSAQKKAAWRTQEQAP